MVRTENGEMVAYVYVDLESGTDVASYVQSARASLSGARRGAIGLAPGERIEWTGQYELMAAGQHRCTGSSPSWRSSMLALLFLQFRSLTEALIVLISVPFALVGSFWTLFLLHYPMSAPVWVGLLSTVGLAMQTGVVMVVYIDEAFHRRVREGRLRSREDIIEAHAEGTVQRLRPKLMTITTMAVGLLPLLWSDGAGAEIMKRVAAPMLGGLAHQRLSHAWRFCQFSTRSGARVSFGWRSGSNISIEAAIGRAPVLVAHRPRRRIQALRRPDDARGPSTTAWAGSRPCRPCPPRRTRSRPPSASA